MPLPIALIDTHSHIYAEEFDADRDEAIRRAREAGVERLLLPAIDSESHGRLFDTVRRYPDHCTPMMGLHPTSINDNPRWREELALVERYLCSPPEGVGRFCAVGEIGLDYYWDDRFKAEQLEAFTKQCRLAATYDLPSPSIRGRPGKICAALSKRKRRPPAKKGCACGVFSTPSPKTPTPTGS